jgi:uncharacterized membrane protein
MANALAHGPVTLASVPFVLGAVVVAGSFAFVIGAVVGLALAGIDLILLGVAARLVRSLSA